WQHALPHLLDLERGVSEQQNRAAPCLDEQHLVARGMTRGGENDNAAITEQVVLGVEFHPLERKVEVAFVVIDGLVDGGRECELELPALHEYVGMWEEVEAAGVIPMKMGHDDVVDVFGFQPDRPELDVCVVLGP